MLFSSVRKPFKCHCGKNYKSDHGYRQHFKMHHYDETTKLKQEEFPHLVSSESVLLEHINGVSVNSLKLLSKSGFQSQCSTNAILSEFQDVQEDMPLSRQSSSPDSVRSVTSPTVDVRIVSSHSLADAIRRVPTPTTSTHSSTEAIRRVPTPTCPKAYKIIPSTSTFVPKDLSKKFSIIPQNRVVLGVPTTKSTVSRGNVTSVTTST